MSFNKFYNKSLFITNLYSLLGMRKFLATSLCSLLMSSTASAEIRSMPHDGGPGWLWLPQEKREKMPLVVLLHGVNKSGKDRVNIHGVRSLEKVAKKLIKEKKIKPSYIGLIDGTCRINYAREVVKALEDSEAAIALYSQARFKGDLSSYKFLQGNDRSKIRCNSPFYYCRKNNDEPFFVYLAPDKSTKVDHEKIVSVAFRNFVGKFFAAQNNTPNL